MTIESATERRAALDTRYTPWHTRTVAQLFDEVAAEHPQRPFIFTDKQTYTYADTQRWSIRLAAGLLTIGVRPGDHVAVDMANLPDFISLKLAISRLGAVSVAINYLLRHEELAYVLRQSDAKVLITMDRLRGLDYLDCLDRIAPSWEESGGGVTVPRLQQIFVRPVDPATPHRGAPLSCLEAAGAAVTDDEVLMLTRSTDTRTVSDILYTSGTTGKPKGVMLTHDAVTRTAYASAYTRAFQDGRRIGYALPMYHVFGYIEAMVAAIYVGGAVAPQVVFDPAKMLQSVARFHIDELICVPAMTTRLLEAAAEGDFDLSALSTMFSSGAPHSPGMWQQMLDVLGVHELFTAYGQSETTASTMCTRPGDPLSRLQTTNGTVKPAAGAGSPDFKGAMAVYKVIATDTGADLPAGEVGELVVRGPAVTPGYYRKPTETAELFTEDGWMHTGDLGRLDEDGYLTLTGRIKESYRFGGELVLPSEVESVLNRHESVRVAHVVGVPHDRLGEVGCAVVVAAEGRTVDEAELIAYCGELLARFKVPAHILVIAERDLPVTVTGRVQKFKLVTMAAQALAARVETVR
ncbi:class I adenylate-forming enzyme family protein [Nocardia sp. NPDC004123]